MVGLLNRNSSQYADLPCKIFEKHFMNVLDVYAPLKYKYLREPTTFYEEGVIKSNRE